jgi:hypothetical protein
MGPVSKESFSKDYGISVRTTDRYISDIRDFLADEHKELELINDRKTNLYYLKKRQN